MNPTLMLILNYLLFQAAWFACVLGGANGHPWFGSGVALLVILLHLSLVPRPRREATLVVLVGLLGALLDSLLVSLGWLDFPSGQLLPGTAPHWIIAMWMAFATVLNVSLGWLRGRYRLAALLGGVAGPLAYYAGAELGGVQLGAEPWLALAGVGLNWALAMPLVILLASRFDGVETDPGHALPSGSATAGRPG